MDKIVKQELEENFKTVDEVWEDAGVDAFYAMPRLFRKVFGWAFGLPVDKPKERGIK